ncbi:hypothetical protein ILYODFUR_013881 [Ilyodon furcidens]|uniref:Secreted protein n=1 Tax=Ilyodon furcidens TaxID=33524 RepID=A0ABV0UK22_9TELE
MSCCSFAAFHAVSFAFELTSSTFCDCELHIFLALVGSVVKALLVSGAPCEGWSSADGKRLSVCYLVFMILFVHQCSLTTSKACTEYLYLSRY